MWDKVRDRMPQVLSNQPIKAELQLIRNQQVGGSIPLAGSIIFPHIRLIIQSVM